MPDNVTPPFLSICIPTYKGAHYLKVTLEAVLPQAAQIGDNVEVVVLDDVSPDDTPAVAHDAQKHGPFRYIRNETNLGIVKNEVYGVLRHVRGEFVWVWNQHCLLHPGALARVLKVVEEQRHLEALYANFRCARYPEDWPQTAVGGYVGPCHYVANADVRSRAVARWEELLSPASALCTQSQVHIVKRSVWQRYWDGRTAGADFSDALTTYPHTCTVAESMFGKPSYYIGEPVITVFMGAQTWGSLRSRSRLWLRGCPDLLRRYQRLGWPREKLRPAQEWSSIYAGKVLVDLFQNWAPEHRQLVLQYVRRYWHYKGVLRAMWKAFLDSQCCWLSRTITKTGAALHRWHRYWFYNCRPARWLRGRKRK